MDGACSMQGKNEECTLLVRKPQGKQSLGNLGVDSRIILKLILNAYKVGSCELDWSTHDRDQWGTLINTASSKCCIKYREFLAQVKKC
jgi:hypothetical protein